MKILSSEVNMQAHTSQDLDFKISRESSLDFKTFLYQPSSNKNDESSIETKKVNAVENKSIVHKEKELPLYDLINKFIIETLLSRFLGKYENNNKMYPNDECCCNCSESGDKSDLNVLSESKQQTVIETKVRFSSETTTEYYKKNAISFNTQATIKTADKDIKIDLDLSYTQEFYESYKEKLEFEQSVFLDPLVIHYDLSSNYFDCITIAFGLRNVTNKEEALSEMYRVLSPGGKLVILEFSKIWAPLSKIYDGFSFNILPKLGKIFAKDEKSYQYLVESIRMHPDQKTLETMMQNQGFDNTGFKNLSGGIVAIHQGYKF